MSLQQDNRSWFQQHRSVPFYNNSGEEIPARAVMKLTNRQTRLGGQELVSDKPDGTGSVFAFNGPNTVAIAGRGIAYIETPVSGLVAAGTASGAVVGPVNASWELEDTGVGYQMTGARDAPTGFGIINAENLSLGYRYGIGKNDGDIGAGSSGTVSVWENGADTTDDITAYWDWGDGGVGIAAGSEVLWAYFPNEAKYRIIGSDDCEGP